MDFLSIATLASGTRTALELSIPDNGVRSVPVSRAGGVALIYNTDPGDGFPDAAAGRFALLWFDAGGSLAAASIAIDTSVTVGTGVATGTTGTDGSLNIRVGAGQIYIENRRGAIRTYACLLLN